VGAALLAALAAPAIAQTPPTAAPRPGTTANASSTTLQVLHWWTSAGERRAANALAARLADEGVVWQDAAIPGGAGLGAGKVLRSRVLAGQAPEVTQIIGPSIQAWAEMGFLLELDGVARSGQWAEQLFPTVLQLIQYRKHVVAAPLGIHRVNTLFYNRRLFAQLKLPPPLIWSDFERAAAALKAAGFTALAQSSEPWQVAGLFENLLLAEAGPALYRELLVRHSEAATNDKRLAQALDRLRALKAFMGPVVAERPWTDGIAQVARGEAGMLVMGDWAKTELADPRQPAPGSDDVGCLAMPGTGRYHLYSVDTLTMLAGDYSHTAAQEKLARVVTSPAVQAEYNQLKGSVPVRRDADVSRMDTCARASWTAFGQERPNLVPSLVHRMATDEARKDAIVAEVHRFFIDDSVTTQQVQRRLAAVFRALQTPARGTDAPLSLSTLAQPVLP
jgi:glucose/mannose transport system substrate-binding protein